MLVPSNIVVVMSPCKDAFNCQAEIGLCPVASFEVKVLASISIRQLPRLGFLPCRLLLAELLVWTVAKARSIGNLCPVVMLFGDFQFGNQIRI